MKFRSKTITFGFIALLGGMTPLNSTAGKVEKLIDVKSNISSTDSLNDVFPTLNIDFLPEDRRPSCFVDGKFLPGNITGNSVVLPHGKGPVFITFDIAPDGSYGKSQLNSVTVWIQGLNNNWQGHKPNFVGHLEVSSDGKHFRVLPGTKVELLGEKTQKYNAVRWTFKPNEVKGFRYLRVVSKGYKRQAARIAEIDADITGVNVPKSTRIQTVIKPIGADKITKKLPKESETIPSPMKIYKVRFAGKRLVIADTRKTVLDMTNIFRPESRAWRLGTFKNSSRELKGTLTRNDGLTKNITAKINDKSRLTVECVVKAPGKTVDYTETSLDFTPGRIKFDGVVDGSSAVYYKGTRACVMEIGDYTPYVMLQSKAENVELQFYIPNWYDIMGRINIMHKKSLIRWDFFVSTQNTRSKLDNPKLKLNSRVWHPTSRKLKPGETLKYKINIAAFTINPKRTLGQIDIEDYPHLPPAKHVDTGVPGLRLSGRSTVLHRDKMQFMGYKLPEPTNVKLGHSVLTHVVVGKQPGMIDRYLRGGVGVVVITGSDYDDVSHGVSWNGDYSKCPPNTQKFIDELHKHNIKVVHWCSPRGFLNRKWIGRPKDPMTTKHPEWFTKHAHWGGNYQTVDAFKSSPSEWIINKITGDMKQYDMDGVAYDSFPQSGTIIGPTGTTIVSKEMQWGEYFYKKVHETKKGALVIGNRATPRFDDYLSIDSGVIENSLWMFLNEVTKGHAAYGRAYTAYLQWGQLYNWWLPLSFMHHNFCDYDMGLGWTPDIWLHWRNPQIPGERKYKDMDKYVVPLWYIMGKGKRIYAAHLKHHVRQIEAKMPDGSVVVIVSSINPAPTNVQAIPQNIPAGKYKLKVSVDTCKAHKDYPEKDIDTSMTPGIDLAKIPPYSIAVLRFKKIN